METTHGTQEDAWTWPCPYCGTSNPLDAEVCPGCRAQLRDPEEDDLFTTVATDNAQMVDPGAPRMRESLWSTEAPPEELVAEEVHEATPLGAPQPTGPSGGAGIPPRGDGPFSQSAPPEPAAGAPGPAPFAPGQSGGANPGGAAPQATPFASSPNAFAREAATAPGPDPSFGGPTPGVPSQPRDGAEASHQADSQPIPAPAEPIRVTPDENGLSVAADRLSVDERESCAVPIGVCGALLGDQEVVLGLLAGHLLGHRAVMMLTNTRILISNARRWKPLLDQFLPSADLTVHVRHDRTVASVTIVQGDRLSTVDDIADVPAAVDMAERIRAMSGRG